MRALGVDPVHDTRTTFRVLVDLMARPGTVESVPVSPADHAVLATLVDHEVTLHTGDDDLREVLSNAGRYEPAPFEDADVIHVRESTSGRIVEAERGTLKEPSDGATVVYRVDGLVEGTAGDRRDDDRPLPDDALALRVAGPGVPGRRTFRVAGLPAEEVAAIADAGGGFPRGVEVVFAAEDRLAALPRSVTMEVA